MKKLRILFILIILISCDNPYEDIVFVEIKNAELLNAYADRVEIAATCVLYNPNSVGLNLQKADFDVYINGRKTATVDQTEDVVMPANARFEFPIFTSINPKEIYGEKGKGILGAALQIIASRKFDIKYRGTLTVGKGSMNFRVPVVDSLSVPVKFNF